MTTAKLVYSTVTSLDGYSADQAGNFEWSMPDPEVHSFINQIERGFGTYLYGRRMYETMRYWETFADQVAVNGVVPSSAPFGGYKQSGLGREVGVTGLREYTETKAIGWPD